MIRMGGSLASRFIILSHPECPAVQPLSATPQPSKVNAVQVASQDSGKSRDSWGRRGRLGKWPVPKRWAWCGLAGCCRIEPKCECPGLLRQLVERLLMVPGRTLKKRCWQSIVKILWVSTEESPEMG